MPIKRISAHARREKSIRHGHISTLHIWWARRPLAACRAVICAALWPDPADPQCPQAFINEAREQMLAWAPHAAAEVAQRGESQAIRERPGKTLASSTMLWNCAALCSTSSPTSPIGTTPPFREYLDTSRALTQAAHEALGGAPGTRPLVVDPFAGGGSIPLEALRVGADAFASDLNPVAVLLNKVVLEYIPKYGQRLADEVRKSGEWVRREAEKELAEFYPSDSDGSQSVAYLWARTIRCEGPSCGATIPVLTNDLLAKRKSGDIRLRLEAADNKQVRVKIDTGGASVANAKTVFRGAVVCPLCKFATPADHVRGQFAGRKGGTDDARLLAVVTAKPGQTQRSYRLPTERDTAAFQKACERLAALPGITDGLPTLPNETLPYLRSIFNINLLDVHRWRDLFTSRQLLLLSTFIRIIGKLPEGTEDREIVDALGTCLAIAVNKMADFSQYAVCLDKQW